MASVTGVRKWESPISQGLYPEMGTASLPLYGIGQAAQSLPRFKRREKQTSPVSGVNNKVFLIISPTVIQIHHHCL